MTGKLTFVATTGLISAAVLLTLGVGLYGQGWAHTRQLWGVMPSACGSTVSTGPQVSLPLTTSDSLVIDLPADVRYQPGGKAEVIVSGDPSLIGHVKMDGARLFLDCNQGWSAPKFNVSVSGPAITRWKLLGSSDLTLSDINQSQLRLSIKGSGSATATGIANTADVDISGSGAARFKGLTTQSAQITIHGSGDAQITAQTDAEVSIYGSGNVELAGHPNLKRAEIKGSGRIQQAP
jgi:hypothetical protein